MKNTIKNLHLSAQYLAATGISFGDKKEDDSHTNTGWNRHENRMETHVFEDHFQLGLNLATQNLEWIKKGIVLATIQLKKTTHNVIVDWIYEQAQQHKIAKNYAYKFHYELPYDKITAEYIYSFNLTNLTYIAAELSKAQLTFEQFLKSEKLDSPIRIWPHHFDLGIYTGLKAENTSMGAGLAIPDALVDDFYFYASGYNRAGAIETNSFCKMKYGEFRSDWNGATFASSGVKVEEAFEFLQEAKLKFQ